MLDAREVGGFLGYYMRHCKLQPPGIVLLGMSASESNASGGRDLGGRIVGEVVQQCADWGGKLWGPGESEA